MVAVPVLSVTKMADVDVADDVEDEDALEVVVLLIGRGAATLQPDPKGNTSTVTNEEVAGFPSNRKN